MIHVPRRPTEGFTPARIANATAVGTAVSPVVMPASHSTRLSLTQPSAVLKVVSRQLNGTGHPQDPAQVYGSSSVRCSCHGVVVPRRERGSAAGFTAAFRDGGTAVACQGEAQIRVVLSYLEFDSEKLPSHHSRIGCVQHDHFFTPETSSESRNGTWFRKKSFSSGKWKTNYRGGGVSYLR